MKKTLVFTLLCSLIISCSTPLDKKYNKENFNPLKGMHDLDTHKIQLVLIDIQEELGFNLNKKILSSL